MSEIINLNDTSPSASAGLQDVKWQKGPQSGTDPATGLPIFPVSAQVPSTGGAVVKTASYTLTAADCGKLIVANSATAITFTLPAAIPFGQWEVRIANIGAGALSVAPGGSLTLDGGITAVSVSQWQGLSIASDGTNYFSTRGIGGSSANATEIQGVGVSTTAPSNGQVLEYNSTSGLYVPTTPSGGGGTGAIVAAAFFTDSGSTVTLVSGKNVSSITRSGTGLYTANFTSALSTSQYIFLGGGKFGDFTSSNTAVVGPDRNTTGPHNRMTTALVDFMVSPVVAAQVFDPTSCWFIVIDPSLL